MIFKKNFSQKKNLTGKLEETQKTEQEKDQIRQTDEYRNYMEKYSIAELKSLIIYSYPYVTDPKFKLSKEELEEIKERIKTANVALEDKKQQMQEELQRDVKKH